MGDQPTLPGMGRTTYDNGVHTSDRFVCSRCGSDSYWVKSARAVNTSPRRICATCGGRMVLRKDEGKRRRDEGIDRVQSNLVAGWMDEACACVGTAVRQFKTFTTDDVRRIADATGLPPPHDGRAWGAVMRRAIKRGMVKKTGEYVPTERPEAHRRPIPVYRGRRPLEEFDR